MDQPETIANYQIIDTIGKGSFGTVYKAKDVDSGNVYALKLENVKANAEYSALKNEFDAYQELNGCMGISNVYYFGHFDETYYLVMDLLGMSVQKIFEERGEMFSIKTVCMIGKRVLDIFEDMHRKNRIYRDIKPDNIVIDINDPTKLYLIDFGMSKNYFDVKTGNHIPLLNNKKLTGTARYASINTHNGIEQSRRDDLESLGYVLVFLAKGSLPWMGIGAPTGKEKYSMIGEKKMSTSIEELCRGLVGKRVFIKYFKYVRELGFEENPNYEYLKDLLNEILEKKGLKDDMQYDWVNNPLGENRDGSTHRRKKKGVWGYFISLFTNCFG
ncbi:Casein kinase I like protein 2 [Astathelohania contejeani]|uniref:Casein kinase I like protein 2 n=1 Tax=Astathelohania contejeani TaxID=164912 RepID=A0ABQ7I1G0_9MICR|nr:Casein kinase I like protein 2 [Thelohania contejeani]